ncbi:MAG: hypothetical protein ACREOP_12700 [Thermodesulfobacteriota bacterium]
MGKIDASEKLSMITALAVGGGNLKKAESSRILSQLQSSAEGRRKRRQRAAPSPQALAAMGVGIEIVRKGGKEPSPKS